MEVEMNFFLNYFWSIENDFFTLGILFFCREKNESYFYIATFLLLFL